MTSKMFFGGWLYPDGLSLEIADAKATFNEEGLDCAARDIEVAQVRTPSAPAKKQFKAFRTGIGSLRCILPGS